MNTPNNRPGFMNRFRDHLPSVLYTEVPLPAFLTTPIQIGSIFRSESKQSIAQTAAAKAAVANKFTLEGEITHGTEARFAISNKDFEIDGDTWVIGNIEYGATARVKGIGQIEKRVATQIVILNGPSKH